MSNEAKGFSKVVAELKLLVYYDTGGYDEFDPRANLADMVTKALKDGTLAGEEGPVEVVAYEIDINVKGIG